MQFVDSQCIARNNYVFRFLCLVCGTLSCIVVASQQTKTHSRGLGWFCFELGALQIFRFCNFLSVCPFLSGLIAYAGYRVPQSVCANPCVSLGTVFTGQMLVQLCVDSILNCMTNRSFVKIRSFSRE